MERTSSDNIQPSGEPSEEELGATQPTPTTPETDNLPSDTISEDIPADLPEPGDEGPIPVEPAENLRGAPSWRIIALLGVLTLLIIGGMSAIGGYRSGQQLLVSRQSTEQYSVIATQFSLGEEDLAAKRLNLARQRFEWVVEQDPSYPGVTDRLAEVLYLMNVTATPTVAPTPTLTPTADLRSVEEKFTQAQQFLAGADWSGAIDILLRLRKENPAYRAIEVDGMLYVGFRNRGVQKIQQNDLEGGTYDLALAERFGPLDAEAQNWRSWAEWYITGASFWEVDWTRVIEYFSQLAPVVPNLMDGSGWTATDRLRIAYIRYGDQLALAGEWCMAQQQYDLANQVGQNPTLEPTAIYAAEQCAGGAEPPPDDGGTPTETPTPTMPMAPADNTDVPPTPADTLEPTTETP